MKQASERINRAECPSCNRKLCEILADYMVGCQYCYIQFEEEIATKLVDLHGSDLHVGKVKLNGKRK